MEKHFNDFHAAKRAALYAAYKDARRELLEEGGVHPHRIHTEAIRRAIATPQPRFWLSPYRVYRILQNTLRGNAPTRTWRTRAGLYAEVMNTYHRLRRHRAFASMPLLFLAGFVAGEPSSGFFMSVSRAGRVVSEQARLRKQQRRHA